MIHGVAGGDITRTWSQYEPATLNVATSAPHQCHQLRELHLGQTRKRLDPLRIIC